MFRILPIAIILMTGFLSFKMLNSQELANEDDLFLPNLETATGTEEELEENKKGSGHARDGAEQEGLEALKKNESGLPDYVSFTPPEENVLLISDAEKELLEKLQIRRKELSAWEDELDLKAGMIEASSKKLDDKIAQLEKLKAQTQELITEYETEEDKKIGSLVKIYSSMKPKDAAKVFDQMDGDVMLLIIDEMSERKAAPILAKMNTKRAKQLTEMLASQRSLADARGVSKK